MSQQMKWFYTFVKKYQWKLLLGMILVTLISVLAIVSPYISGMIVDEVITNSQLHMLTGLIACMIGATALRGVLRFSSQYLFEYCSQAVLYDMRSHVYWQLLSKDFAFYNKNRTGDLMSRQTGDMEAVRHFVAFTIYSVYENILLFGCALVMIFTVNSKLALYMICVLPIVIFATWKQSKSVRPVFWNIRQRFSSLNAFVQENISGNRVVKAFAKEDYEIEKFNKENDGYRDAELKAADVWSRFVPVFEFLSTVLTVILILVGGMMVMQGEMSLGNLVTVNGYLWMLMVPIRMFGWFINDIQRFATSIEKIHITVMEKPKVRHPRHAIDRPRLDGSVEFNHVSYKADDEDIIMDISFSAKPGQTIGIIGPTGAGKSTIMNLICRFYDVTDGEVKLDGINVKDLNLYDLRDNIGMAMQDVFLFSDTIEGNIAYARPSCSFEKVEWAAKIADAHDFIINMPEGYDTIVGERGVGLSGGQKQRISLARALLKDPSIIILDDTTSAVDMETEIKIRHELDTVGRDRTTFIIASRVSSIRHADQILVMNQGHIIERGTHEQLIKQDGYYSHIFHHQSGDFNYKKGEAKWHETDTIWMKS